MGGINLVRLAFAPEFKLRPEAERVGWVQDWCERVLLPILKAAPTDRHYAGIDFGRYRDLSVLWLASLAQDLSLKTTLVLELRDCPFEQQKQIVLFILDHVPRFMAAAFDAGGNGSYLAEVATQHYGTTRIAEVNLSQEWYRENSPRFVARFDDGRIDAPQDADILADLRSIKKVNGVAMVPRNERTKGQDKKERHGDAAVAGMLLVHAADVMESAVIEFEPVPRRPEDAGDFDDNPDDFDTGCP